MSEYFSGVTFAQQKVTPSDDAVVRKAVLPDGVLTGCEISYSGSTLTMASGYLIACGRLFRHTTAENWPVVDATSGFARLVITLDLTKTATKDTFDQIEADIEYATAADGFSGLIQSDINAAGSKYQIEACVVSLGTGGITGIVSQIALSAVSGIKMERIWANASPTSTMSKDTKITVDIGAYDMFAITARWNNTQGGKNMFFGKPGETVNMSMFSASTGVGSARTVSIGTAESNTITFNEGAHNGNTNAAFMIPHEIYGIKGVKM